MSWRHTTIRRPRVLVLGNSRDASFGESLELLRSSALVVQSGDELPELVVVCQSRPSETRRSEIEALQRRLPLAGFVSLLGSWCEGETRTGRPAPGVTRLYWYDFPQWWRRQMMRHEAGLCPDWARSFASDVSLSSIRNPKEVHLPRREIRNCHSLVVLSTEYGSTAEALSDVLNGAGFATVYKPRGRSHPFVRGASAGIWEGGQLDDGELVELTSFCQRGVQNGSPVIALLDFPRCDAIAKARAAGASIIVGKPWLNADLIGALTTAATQQNYSRAA
jgi:hypothetical protein